MDLDLLLERLRVGFLWIFFGASFLFLMNLAYQRSLKYAASVEYMSGMLLFEDQLKCGIVKTQNMDRFSCKFSGALCSDLKDLNRRKIRIMARKVECGTGVEIACARTGEFNDGSFDADSCYENYEMVKVFPKELE